MSTSLTGRIGGSAAIADPLTDLDALETLAGTGRYKLAIVKAPSAAIAAAQADGARYIYAEADPDEKGAVRWITSLGFRPTGAPRMYRWARHSTAT